MMATQIFSAGSEGVVENNTKRHHEELKERRGDPAYILSDSLNHDSWIATLRIRFVRNDISKRKQYEKRYKQNYCGINQGS